MRVLFLTEGTEVPASRYRCEQFFPHFQRHGVDCTLIGAYGPAYNRIFTEPWAPAYKLATRAVRGLKTAFASGHDVLFLQRLAVPHTALFETLAARRGLPLIFDFDDSIHLDSEGRAQGPRHRAFKRVLARADHVIAGNTFLAREASAWGKTSTIPTVIDTDRYTPRTEARDPNRVVIGWMGTAGNFPHLRAIVPALKTILECEPNVHVRLVSNAELDELSGVPRVEQIRWKPETEIELLRSFDIGLMPLHDTPLTRGKCGFKMIQYMAVGTPVVVSAVGANNDIFAPDCGHALPDFEGWADALCELVQDKQARVRGGDAGRERAVAHFSVKAVLPRYLEIFNSVAG
jgi:glycosyltransferase involved in cell wall biosynthesis